MPEMVAPRALVFRPLVKGNEALGTRLGNRSQRFVHAQCRLERNVTFPVAVVRPAITCDQTCFFLFFFWKEGEKNTPDTFI